MKGNDIRDQFGVNQWLEQKQIITSLDLAKRTEVLPGLQQVHWDLVIIDEAHRMSARDETHKSQRYRLGDVRRLRPHPETEMTAMRVIMEYETAQGHQVEDVHEKNLGYDITSLDPASGELRLIEIKGLAVATGSILLTPNERRVAEDRRECYWLYVVTNCASTPELQEPIKDPGSRGTRSSRSPTTI